MVKVLRESNEIKTIPIECIKGATLLSADEAENLLTQEERKCKGSQEAISNGLWVAGSGNSIYWLRSKDYYNCGACRVSSDGDVGHILYVDGTHIGIRPTLILNLQSSNLCIGDRFIFGDYTFKIISNNLALCDIIVDACCFNLQNKEDGNDYETSYVKQRVDKWFNETYAYEKKLSTQKYRSKSVEAIADENDWGF